MPQTPSPCACACGISHWAHHISLEIKKQPGLPPKISHDAPRTQGGSVWEVYAGIVLSVFAERADFICGYSMSVNIGQTECHI